MNERKEKRDREKTEAKERKKSECGPSAGRSRDEPPKSNLTTVEGTPIVEKQVDAG